MATLPGNVIFRPVTYPSTLAGKSNGKLPSDILTSIPFPGGGSASFEKTAARAFAAMLSAMAAAGFKMMSVGGYRTYDQQLTLWNQRYYIVNYNSGLSWNGHYWVKRPNVATAAKPGTSNHGWGLADDLAQNLDADSEAESISQAAVNWLVANADRYGISAELQSEAWHWRYYRGDNIPQAVLDFEKGTGGAATNMFCKFGDKNDNVLALQVLLSSLGFSTKGTDGQYGDNTAAALRAALNDPPGTDTTNTGKNYGPWEYSAIMIRQVGPLGGVGAPGPQGPEGPAGPKGDKGDAAVLAPGSTLLVQ